jgi:nucleoside-diphosphate-sugar epimerase
MKVLLTGATGFLGRVVARQLAERGADLRCMVRAESDRSVLAGTSCEFVEGDLATPDSLRPAVEGCSTILHLGAQTAPSPAARLHAVNVVGSGELARHAKEAGVERLVYASTLLVSRHGAGLPRSWARVARSKLDGEAAILEHMPAVVMRAAPCFGANDHLTCPLMAKLRRPLPIVWFPGQGTFQTQPIWVEDLAECLALAALEGKAESGPRELAGPEVVSLLEFWDEVAIALRVFRLRLHLPETYLKVIGFPLARALGRTESLRLAETFIGHSAAERNFAPVLLGRPLITLKQGLARMLGVSGKSAAPAKAEA